ncbi:hypothetical protein [Krasilnikovia cinnamomea]|nr:hypothetical protein [Krasilnikovia cinnamomea]
MQMATSAEPAQLGRAPGDPDAPTVPWHLPPELRDGSGLDVANSLYDGNQPPGTVGVHVRRRTLLWGLATVTAAAGLLSPQSAARRRIGTSDVARLNALITLYRTTDHQFGGGALVDDVGVFAESVSALLDQRVDERLRPKLVTAIANARDLAAWTAFDACRHSDAQRHFAAAERYAIESGDRQLVAHIRYGQAKQMQHLRHNREALEILHLAHHRLNPTPAMTAILSGAQAASLAALGDAEGAERALGTSSEAFTRVAPGSEPEWLGFFDEGELLAQYGRVYRDRARADQRHGEAAVSWVSAAIEAFGPQSVRSTVLNQVGLASAYFLAGAPELALQAGNRARVHATAVVSPRVQERLANLRRDAHPYRAVPEVADFLHTLPTVAVSSR